jgi:hypothetical protein
MRERGKSSPDFGEQELFFQRLQDNLGSRIRLAPVVASTLNISEKTAYRKIRGDVTLFFEEALQLERLILPGADGHHHSRFRLSAHSSETPLSLEGYWKILEESIRLWSKSTMPSGYMETTGIPNLLYFEFPELATFRYHLMTGGSRFHQQEVAQAESWLTMGKNAMNIWFGTGKSHLIIDKSECIDGLRLILSALSRHQRRDPVGANRMKEQAWQVLQKLKDVASCQQQRSQIYLTQFGITRPVACLLNGDRGQTLWPMPGLGVLSTNDPHVARYYHRVFELKIRSSSLLNKSPMFCKLLFESLEDIFDEIY